MFCMKCGTALPDDACFCYSCGSKIDIQALRALNGGGQAATAPVNSPTPAKSDSSVKTAGAKGNEAVCGDSLGYEYYCNNHCGFSHDYIDNRDYVSNYDYEYNNEIYMLHDNVVVFTMLGEFSRDITLNPKPNHELNNMVVNECGIYLYGLVDRDICVYKYSHEGKLIKDVTVKKPSKYLNFSPYDCLSNIRICGNRFAYTFMLDGDIDEPGSAVVGIYDFENCSNKALIKDAQMAHLHSFYDNFLCVGLAYGSKITCDDIDTVPKLADKYEVGDEIGSDYYKNHFYIIDLEKKTVFNLSSNISDFSLYKNRKKYLKELAVIDEKSADVFSVHMKEKIIWVREKEGEKEYLKPVELVLKNGAALGPQSKRYPVFDISEICCDNIAYFDGNSIIKLGSRRGIDYEEYNNDGLYSKYHRESNTCDVGEKKLFVSGDKIYLPYYNNHSVLKRTPGQYTPVKFADGICWAD